MTWQHTLQETRAEATVRLSKSVIQNVADPRRNGRIGKVFELSELRFRSAVERDFRI